MFQLKLIPTSLKDEKIAFRGGEGEGGGVGKGVGGGGGGVGGEGTKQGPF